MGSASFNGSGTLPCQLSGGHSEACLGVAPREPGSPAGLALPEQELRSLLSLSVLSVQPPSGTGGQDSWPGLQPLPLGRWFPPPTVVWLMACLTCPHCTGEALGMPAGRDVARPGLAPAALPATLVPHVASQSLLLPTHRFGTRHGQRAQGQLLSPISFFAQPPGPPAPLLHLEWVVPRPQLDLMWHEHPPTWAQYTRQSPTALKAARPDTSDGHRPCQLPGVSTNPSWFSPLVRLIYLQVWLTLSLAARYATPNPALILTFGLVQSLKPTSWLTMPSSHQYISWWLVQTMATVPI